MSDLEPAVSFKPNSNEVTITDSSATIINVETLQQTLEEQELQDKIQPIKGNYDNKAFELEDVDINSKNDKNSNFSRIDRPGSMMSIRSTTSRSSRSSVNCTTGRVRCPNLRLQKFYAYKDDGGFRRASEDIKQLILPEKDGNFIGTWLLVEISIWDLHRERVVVLAEKTLFIVTYDFIKLKIYEYKRISLADLKKVNFGQLQYPKGSLMEGYQYGAVKIVYGTENLSFLEKWNPINSDVPLLMLTSHHILYNEKEKESEIYNCDEFLANLEFAMSKLPEVASIEFKEEPIEISSYASLVSVLYNQNWLGFQLDRNGVSF